MAEAETAVRELRGGGEAAGDGSFVLTVIEGPGRGRSFTVDGTQAGPVLIGQGPACEIRLEDPTISRRHAALEPAGGDLRVTDLGSTNGTFVDRVKVAEAYLRGGEHLIVGSTALRVDREEGAPRPEPEAADGFGALAGASPQMRRLYPLCRRVAQTDVPVIVEGETGTGKEVLAQALHDEGPRAAGPFVVFDCTAVAPTLIESELFGHERGAFTSALGRRIGVFEQAQGGTLFIDEIGDLDLALQPKLLRALERGEIRRVGGDQWIKVDVRVIAATRRDLDRAVQAGQFRDDLFYRLSVARIELPPLRRRSGDVRLLAQRFWRDFGGQPAKLTEERLRRWEDYAWPGNVRELRNAVARQRVLGDQADSGPRPADGPEGPVPWHELVEAIVRSGTPFFQARDRLLEEFEDQYVARVLAEHGGDVAAAAAASGIGKRYFYKLRARQATRGADRTD